MRQSSTIKCSVRIIGERDGCGLGVGGEKEGPSVCPP